VQNRHDQESGRRRGAKVAALILSSAFGLLPLACGGGDDGAGDAQILHRALRDFGKPTVVLLDTAALAQAARAGAAIDLPFARAADDGGGIVTREVQLTLRNLRNQELTEFVLKDGDAGSGSSMPLPPPATYQGKVQDGGVAVFTINDAVVEGSMLVSPDGWSFIEPLEPQLRLNGVPPGARQRLLSKYNHIVYNTRDALDSRPGNDDPGMSSLPPDPPAPPSPLVMSIVADGDAALFRAYPLDSVMPFWLKQETLLNAVDWLYNCVEPKANVDNAYADCDNDFDGGSGNFQARVRIDGLEVWTTGGPDSTKRGTLLTQSISMTHQASPPCCGEPHTAGRSSLVHFLSGRDLDDGAGLAAGEGGLNYYGERCSDPGLFLCHHAVSQIVSGHDFRGIAFYQQLLVAHEIGHNNLAREAFAGDFACWLFEEDCGSSVMSSNPFTGRSLYLYTVIDSEPMGRHLAEQLGSLP
jgi:hypothetical protein